MKFLAWSLSGVALAVFVTGCQPDLAQVKPGSLEEYWEQFVDRSYSGFRPSRTAPPAIVDKVSPELRAQEQQPPAAGAETETEQLPAVNAADVAPADDPVTVEVAEDKNAVIAPETGKKAGEQAQKPVAEKTEEAKPDAKAVPTPETAGGSVVYVVKPGDTLSFISKKFYHNAGRYDLIMKANPQLKNPNALRPGMKLQIPQL